MNIILGLQIRQEDCRVCFYRRETGYCVYEARDKFIVRPDFPCKDYKSIKSVTKLKRL